MLSPLPPGAGRGQVSRREPADRGTGLSRAIALTGVAVLYAVLAISQNMAPYLVDKDAQLGREPRGSEIAKLLLLVEHGLRELGGGAAAPLGGMAAGEFAGSRHPADRLQSVLVLGEAEGAGVALDWLDAIRMNMELTALSESSRRGQDWQQVVAEARAGAPEPPGETWALVEISDGERVDAEAAADAAVMERLYAEGAGSLSAEQRDRLIDRYGWLGELALTHGLDREAPERRELFAKWPWAVLMILLVGAVFMVGLVGGLAAFVLALVMYFTGRLGRGFVPPERGGSVYLETFAVFLGMFLLVHVLGEAAGRLIRSGKLEASEAALTAGVLAAQWLLLPVLLWPLLRGTSWRGWRSAVGWRAPRGVWREIGAGIVGYFAGLPLFFLGIALTFGLNVLAERVFGERHEPPSNPVFDLVTSGSVLVVVMVALLATVWAPIMEETIFRGGLYRHLRSRSGAVVAGLVTALLFAFLHSYGPLMTGPLIALGFTFAMIREWRGSLIGPMTAHCLHNGTVMTISLLMLLALA